MDKLTHCEQIKELEILIKDIKSEGWHLSTRDGDTGIGKTFEDLLEKKEDNYALPDFHDFEIKTHRQATRSPITLFTKSPTYPKRAISMLKNAYGYPDNYGNNNLHITIFGHKNTKSDTSRHQFGLRVDHSTQRIYIEVYSYDGNQLINDDVYWTFEDINKQLQAKIPNLALVSAQTKTENGNRYYKYTAVELLTNFNIDNLIKAIENGKMAIDLRAGSYRSGKNEGKPHDHGVAFRIKKIDLINFGEKIEIEEN